MRSLHITVLACLAAAGLMLAPKAQADEDNKLTTVTFSAPVEIPGRVLAAGTYMFKLADELGDRNIVQIFNADQTKLYATVIAVPDERLTPAGRTVITFERRAAGAPEAIKAWFYPGDEYGQEFVYPKVRATQLARDANQNVPCVPSALAGNMTKPAKSSDAPHIMAMKQAHLTAVKPSGEELEIAREITPPETISAPTPTVNMKTSEEPGRLPQTASSLPLIGLIGLLGMLSGATLRFASKRIQ